MTLRRSFWHAVETIHHVIYFAPDAKATFEAIGLKGQWMGYFASRSAALGTPGPEVVVAAFHGFAPRLVHRALPTAWELATRDDILAARHDLARRTIAPGFEDVDVAALAAGLQAGLPGLDLAGRPLAAGQVGLPVPADDLGAAWHAASALREYRGDSHLAVLTVAGLDGVTANVLAVAAGMALPHQQKLRGWTDEEWERGAARLRTRGWIDDANAITEAGIVARTQIETDTDRATAAGISDEAVAHFSSVAGLAVTASKQIVSAGIDPTAHA
ncbi:MAG: MarR family transcriptional regulator [Aeromicrobium sp.]